MHSKTLARVALLCSLAIPSLVAAEPPYDTVFETVDGIGLNFGAIDITGIVRGEGTSRTVEMVVYTAGSVDASETFKTCQRYAEVTMSKPGQYYFELRGTAGSSYVYFYGCKLTRR